jgi:hypothetical protein
MAAQDSAPQLDAKDTIALRKAETEARTGHVATGLKLLHDTLGPNPDQKKGEAYTAELKKAGLLTDFSVGELQEKRSGDHKSTLYKADVDGYQKGAANNSFDQSLLTEADNKFGDLNGGTSLLGYGHYVTKSTMKDQLASLGTEHRSQAFVAALYQKDDAGKTLYDKLQSDGHINAKTIEAQIRSSEAALRSPAAAARIPNHLSPDELNTAIQIKNAIVAKDPAMQAIFDSGSLEGYAKDHPGNNYLTPDPTQDPLKPVATVPWTGEVKPKELPVGAIPTGSTMAATLGDPLQPISPGNAAGRLPAEGAAPIVTAAAAETRPDDAKPKIKPVVEVKPGWGPWSVAANALGYPEFGNKMGNKPLTPAQLNQIYELSLKIRHANHGRTIFAGDHVTIPEIG